MSKKITIKEVKPLSVKEIKQLSKKAQNAINEEPEDEEGEGSGKIVSILRLFNAGVPPAFIVRLGFNKSTTYRQVGDLKKFRKAPAMSMYGFELYEARLQRIMKTKGTTRDAAAKIIADTDINS